MTTAAPVQHLSVTVSSYRETNAAQGGPDTVTAKGSISAIESPGDRDRTRKELNEANARLWMDGRTWGPP